MQRVFLTVDHGQDRSARRVFRQRFGLFRCGNRLQGPLVVIDEIAVFILLGSPAHVRAAGIHLVGLLASQRFGMRRVVRQGVDGEAEPGRHGIVVGKRVFLQRLHALDGRIGRLDHPADLPDHIVVVQTALHLFVFDIDPGVRLVRNGIAVLRTDHHPASGARACEVVALGRRAGTHEGGVALVKLVALGLIARQNAGEHVYAQVVFDVFEAHRLLGADALIIGVVGVFGGVGARHLPHAHVDRRDARVDHRALVGRIARNRLHRRAQGHLPIHHEAFDGGVAVDGLVEQDALLAFEIRVVNHIDAQVGVAHQGSQRFGIDARRGFRHGDRETARTGVREHVVGCAVAVDIDRRAVLRALGFVEKLDVAELVRILLVEYRIEHRERTRAGSIGREHRLGLEHLHASVVTDGSVPPCVDPRTVGLLGRHVGERPLGRPLLELLVELFFGCRRLFGGAVCVERNVALGAHVVDAGLQLQGHRRARGEVAVGMHARAHGVEQRVVTGELVVIGVGRRGHLHDQHLAVVVFGLHVLDRQIVQIVDVGLGVVGVREVVGAPIGHLHEIDMPPLLAKLRGREDKRLRVVGHLVFKNELVALMVVFAGQRFLVVEAHIARKLHHEAQLGMHDCARIRVILRIQGLVFDLHRIPRRIAVLQRLARKRFLLAFVGHIVFRNRARPVDMAAFFRAVHLTHHGCGKLFGGRCRLVAARALGGRVMHTFRVRSGRGVFGLRIGIGCARLRGIGIQRSVGFGHIRLRAVIVGRVVGGFVCRRIGRRSGFRRSLQIGRGVARRGGNAVGGNVSGESALLPLARAERAFHLKARAVGFGVELDGVRRDQTRIGRAQLQRGEHALVDRGIGTARRIARERLDVLLLAVAVEQREQRRRVGGRIAVGRRTVRPARFGGEGLHFDVLQGEPAAERVVFHAGADRRIELVIIVLEAGQAVRHRAERRMVFHHAVFAHAAVRQHIGGNDAALDVVAVIVRRVEAIIVIRRAVALAIRLAAHLVRIALDVDVGQESVAVHLRRHVAIDVLVRRGGFFVGLVGLRRCHRAHVNLKCGQAARWNTRLGIALGDRTVGGIEALTLGHEAQHVALAGLAGIVFARERLARHEHVEKPLIGRIVAGKGVRIVDIVVRRGRRNRPIGSIHCVGRAVGGICPAFGVDRRNALGKHRGHHRQHQIAHRAAVGSVGMQIATIGIVRRVVPLKLVEPIAVLNVDIQLHAIEFGIEVILVHRARGAVVAHGAPGAHERLALHGGRTRSSPDALVGSSLVGL